VLPVLVLLPPSEGKAVGTDGPPLDLDALSFPALTATRSRVVAAVVRAATRTPGRLADALGLSTGQRAEVDKDAALRTAPTLPVMDLYTGVVYDNLGYATLRGAARKRADASLVVASALFGLLRPADRVPSYRLSGGTTVPGLGGLGPVWRPALEPVLAEVGDLVVDLRSGDYAKLARVPGAVEVRVLRDVDGRRTTVSHDNKWTKGRLARALCEQSVRTVADVAEVGRTVCDAVEVDGTRVDLLLHGLASAR
jgi:uncharacterized protein